MSSAYAESAGKSTTLNKKKSVLDSVMVVNMLLPEIDLENLPELGRVVLAEVEPVLPTDRVGERGMINRAHAIAIKNWLGKYRPSASASGQGTARGYQEAYCHLREIGALQQALIVKRVSLRIQKAVARQRWRHFEETQRREPK
ncbi:hypothetical protein [cf. Phormidesmis sp. LEGE 11477]|uniref:hypothetical protein n=1 Tax=cf. Phormidesmis sp. LEGE 11477 TaxID=1828680 RepID=UPI001880C244|nr:hypothetical protein [cf. Phormidesmis sp. LEGE 11477]MBE9064834.1 hypothetical protein [cf. Phormidesmis sp. LEGE 11477]